MSTRSKRVSRYFSDNPRLSVSVSASRRHISKVTGHFFYDYRADGRTHTRPRARALVCKVRSKCPTNWLTRSRDVRHDTTNPKCHDTVMPTMRRTTITVSKRTKNELFNLKTEESDTYDDVVSRLIREREEVSDE